MPPDRSSASVAALCPSIVPPQPHAGRRRQIGRWALAAAAAPLFGSRTAGAQGAGGAQDANGWPNRPVTLILPFGAGATADAFARTIAPRLAESLGQPVVVENRPGGGGTIGSLQAARANPDGHTLLVTFATHYSLPFLQKAVPYDPLADFTPIIAAARIQTVLVVHPGHPARTMADFVARARTAQDGVLYGSGGLLLYGELLAQAAGIRMTHVAYKGGGPMLTDLVGGQIDTGISVLSTVIPHIEAGRLRALAVLSNRRPVAAPSIPAVTETVPSFQPQDNWVGLLGPRGLPGAIADRLNGEVRRLLATPEVGRKLTELGFETTGELSPAELAAAARVSVETFRRVTEKAGIVPE